MSATGSTGGRSTDGPGAGLAEHLASHYGIEVTGVHELDLGVFRVERADGGPWVARVFPAGRPLGAVEGDARILSGLERAGFPAERCAHEAPVSELAGQGVLVTSFVPGPKAGGGRGFAHLGALLGPAAREAARGRACRKAACVPSPVWHQFVTR